jgi:hypothetical protein
MDDDRSSFIEKQMGHKFYGRVPRLGRIVFYLLVTAIACGLLLYLAVWAKLIQ